MKVFSVGNYFVAYYNVIFWVAWLQLSKLGLIPLHLLDCNNLPYCCNPTPMFTITPIPHFWLQPLCSLLGSCLVIYWNRRDLWCHYGITSDLGPLFGDGKWRHRAPMSKSQFSFPIHPLKIPFLQAWAFGMRQLDKTRSIVLLIFELLAF